MSVSCSYPSTAWTREPARGRPFSLPPASFLPPPFYFICLIVDGLVDLQTSSVVLPPNPRFPLPQLPDSYTAISDRLPEGVLFLTYSMLISKGQGIRHGSAALKDWRKAGPAPQPKGARARQQQQQAAAGAAAGPIVAASGAAGGAAAAAGAAAAGAASDVLAGAIVPYGEPFGDAAGRPEQQQQGQGQQGQEEPERDQAAAEREFRRNPMAFYPPGTRLRQLFEWLRGYGEEGEEGEEEEGAGGEGCFIVLDECHRAKNLLLGGRRSGEGAYDT